MNSLSLLAKRTQVYRNHIGELTTDLNEQKIEQEKALRTEIKLRKRIGSLKEELSAAVKKATMFEEK